MKRISIVLLAALLVGCQVVPPAKIAEETTVTTTAEVTTTASVTTIAEIPLSSAPKKIDLGVLSPINKNASAGARAVLSFLGENYGEKIISGQYAADAENAEIELIHDITGKYPAIRFSDVGEDAASVVSASIDWGKQGGLVGLMWHWKAPTGGGFYAKDTDFNLAKAVTKEKIATKSLVELQKMVEDKKISAECLALVQDIDGISAELKKLNDAGVPVLWRPLHEASGGWFWWGSAGKDAYSWLWELLYERQTNYHKLDNLLWVWNAQDPDWYEPCDVVAADIYGEDGDSSAQAMEFAKLSDAAKGKKPVGLSECGKLPDIDVMAKNGATWSFFGQWYGEYVMDKFGDYNEEYTTKEQLIKVYNSAGTLTLDELPLFG